MRVPPDQSGTARAAPATAASSPRVRSSLVMRVSEVEKTNASSRTCRRAEGVREVQEHPRIALHRAADIAQQDDRPPAHPAFPAWEPDHIAAGAKAARPAPAEGRCAARRREPSGGSCVFQGSRSRRSSAARATAISSGVNSAKSLDASTAAALQVRSAPPSRFALVLAVTEHLNGRRPLVGGSLCSRKSSLGRDAPPSRRLAPEHVERAIEDREVVATVHEQRATRVVDLVARRRCSRAGAPRHVQHPADVHVECRAARSSRPKTSRLLDE